jgi:hypothetical protein
VRWCKNKLGLKKILIRSDNVIQVEKMEADGIYAESMMYCDFRWKQKC